MRGGDLRAPRYDFGTSGPKPAVIKIEGQPPCAAEGQATRQGRVAEVGSRDELVAARSPETSQTRCRRHWFRPARHRQRAYPLRTRGRAR
jgi:hypothetical protein